MTKRETQKEIVDNCKIFIVRDVCISTTQRVIEHAIVDHTDPQFSHKLFKSGQNHTMLLRRCEAVVAEQVRTDGAWRGEQGDVLDVAARWIRVPPGTIHVRGGLPDLPVGAECAGKAERRGGGESRVSEGEGRRDHAAVVCKEVGEERAAVRGGRVGGGDRSEHRDICVSWVRHAGSGPFVRNVCLFAVSVVCCGLFDPMCGG